MSRRDSLERRARDIIINAGKEGILQPDLWRQLKISSRSGSRISLNLSNKKLIIRKRELCEGRWTYRVFINIRPVEINSILDIPCISCQDIIKCEAGGNVSPETCKLLTEFLLTFPNKEEKVESDSEVT